MTWRCDTLLQATTDSRGSCARRLLCEGPHSYEIGGKQINQLLQRAFERAAELPQAEQDKFARFLLAELESEGQWAELFARTGSEDLLERLADEALSEHRAGRIRPLTVEDL